MSGNTPLGEGDSAVVCPHCLRERDRMDTFITHICVDSLDCKQTIMRERNALRARFNSFTADEQRAQREIADCHRLSDPSKIGRLD